MPATLTLIAVCALAGPLAQWAGLPLPYLLGPLLASALICSFARGWLPPQFKGLATLRLGFIGVIGVLIGAQVTAELFADTHLLALSFLALMAFVPLCIALNFALFHRMGRYDRASAFYAAMPGGFYESISFAETAGADPARVILQQFLRIVLIVTLLPIGLSLWLGAPVGSAGGMSLARGDTTWSGLMIVLGAILAGIALGQALRLPAGHLTGPMAVGAALSLSGVVTPELPQWLIDLALIVVGTALGTRFYGLSRAQLGHGAGLAALSVAGMMALATLIALALAHQTGQNFDLLLVSFAPGGATEMTLIALSLAGNPALVTLHHVVRILLTVLVMSGTARWVHKGL